MINLNRIEISYEQHHFKLSSLKMYRASKKFYNEGNLIKSQIDVNVAWNDLLYEHLVTCSINAKHLNENDLSK